MGDYHYHYRDCLPVRRRYGFGRLLLDFTLTLITGGLWLLWILIRYLRSNSRY